jgi:hypothetical protein
VVSGQSVDDAEVRGLALAPKQELLAGPKAQASQEQAERVELAVGVAPILATARDRTAEGLPELLAAGQEATVLCQPTPPKQDLVAGDPRRLSESVDDLFPGPAVVERSQGSEGPVGGIEAFASGLVKVNPLGEGQPYLEVGRRAAPLGRERGSEVEVGPAKVGLPQAFSRLVELRLEMEKRFPQFGQQLGVADQRDGRRRERLAGNTGAR